MNLPPIIPRTDWEAVKPRSTKADPIFPVPLQHRTGMVVHHTVTPSGNSIEEIPGIIRSIQRYHMTAKQCNDIGYNFLVDKWGNIYEGRGLNFRGAHAGGHNSMNWGVAFIGNDDATLQTENALAMMYLWFNTIRNVTLQELCHKDVNATSCPGTTLTSFVHNHGLRSLQKDDSPYGLNVQRTAAYLNARRLAKTTSANLDGIPGINYWWLIQTAGRMDGLYPKNCIIDGIPGKYTRACEAHYFELSEAIQKRNLQPLNPNAENLHLNPGQIEGF